VDPLPVYILAGGKSSRFGSDKARAVLAGQPMVARVAARLAPVAASVTVVADVAGKYADLGLTTIADASPGAGPVGGLVTALGHCEDAHGAGWLLLAACDLVDVDAALVGALRAAAGSTMDRSSRAVAFRAADGRWEPMLGLYATALRADAERWFADGERAMWRVLEAAGATAVDLPGGRAGLGQVNTQAEHRRAANRPHQ